MCGLFYLLAVYIYANALDYAFTINSPAPIMMPSIQVKK